MCSPKKPNNHFAYRKHIDDDNGQRVSLGLVVMLATRLEASAVDVPYPRTRALRICQRPRFRGHRQQAVSRTTQKQALSSRRRSQLLSQAHVRVRLMVLRVAAQVLAEVLAEFSYRPIAELPKAYTLALQLQPVTRPFAHARRLGVRGGVTRLGITQPSRTTSVAYCYAPAPPCSPLQIINYYIN